MFPGICPFHLSYPICWCTAIHSTLLIILFISVEPVVMSSHSFLILFVPSYFLSPSCLRFANSVDLFKELIFGFIDCLYLFFPRLNFLRGVLGSQSLELSIEISHIPPCRHTCIASPITNIIHHNSTFVTKDEPTLMHHNHPKSIKYLKGFTLAVPYSTSLDKCTKTIHHYKIIQSSFTPLCSVYSFLSPTLLLAVILLSSYFCLFQKSYSWNHTVCSLS